MNIRQIQRSALYKYNREYIPVGRRMEFCRAVALAVRACDSMLDGIQAVRVRDAFTWSYTPQGYSYWNSWAQYLEYRQSASTVQGTLRSLRVVQEPALSTEAQAPRFVPQKDSVPSRTGWPDPPKIPAKAC